MPAEQKHPNSTPQLEAQPSGPGDETQQGCIRKLGRRKAELSFFATGVLGVLVGAIPTFWMVFGRVRPREPCPPAPAFSHVCPNGWVGFQGKCFYFSDDQRDWNSSRELCQQLGASLATLHTEEEMAFVRRYQGQRDHWIGLRRAEGDVADEWKWADGRTFTDWSQPSGRGPCGYLSSAGLGSTFCHDEKPRVCSRADSFVLWRDGAQPR